MKYLIIGNSAAAVAAVEAIRRRDPEGEIALVSDEPHPAYSRPLISERLSGHLPPAGMGYRPASFYSQMRVEIRLGCRAEAIDRERREVLLEGGERIGFDRLLLATGSRPFVPPIEGAERALSFNSLADAERMEQAAGAARTAVVIGGGLIGLKAAEALRRRGLAVTVVELAERILSTALDRVGSELMQARLEAEGVRVLTGISAAAIEQGSVTLTDGTRLEAELAVISVGVRPNTELAEAAGLKVERGIVVDAHQRTDDPGIFAAGDCAQAKDLLSGGDRPIQIWPVAVRQGAVAGANMAGEELAYPGGMAKNSLELFGLASVAVGVVEPEPKDKVLVAPDVSSDLAVLRQQAAEATVDYRKLVLRGNRLVGAVFVGRIERAGIITGLIRSGAPAAKIAEKLLEGPALLTLPREWRKRNIEQPPDMAKLLSA